MAWMGPTSQSQIQLRCVKCPRNGSRRRFDTVWVTEAEGIWGLHGIDVQTDLADAMEAQASGRDYRSPDWWGSSPYFNKCRCGNRPKLTLETLKRLVREAAESGKSVLYI